MKKQSSPQVDPADVEEIVDFMFGKSINSKLTADERADGAYQVALHVSLVNGRTKEYAEAIAKKVRQKVMWLKEPTGRPAKFPT